MKTKTLLSTTLLLASAISACDVPPDTTGAPAPGATAPVVAKAGAKPTLIHSEEIGPGHKVEFYRLASGMAGYLETGATTDTLLLRDKKGMDSLAKVFQRVAPTRQIPAALLDADRTAQELELSQARQVAEAGEPPAPEGELAPRPMMSPASSADDAISTQQSDLKLYICSADNFGDNWSRQWWFDNFCYTNRSQYVQCNANIGTFANNYNIKHFNYSAFEGDFNEKGHTRGMSRLCTWTIFYGWDCWWYADFDFDVAPRTVGTLGYTGSPSWVRVESTSPCGHLGYVAGWD
jgi:hypothetical protein